MSEQDVSPAEINRIPATLSFARAYYAGALLAARHQPDDPHRQQRAAEAWEEYREAAQKAGLSSIPPPSGCVQEPD